MIEANDVRIGNWVMFGNYTHKIRLQDFYDEVAIGKFNHFSPIPLTPDILVKCGFGINMTGNAWWDTEDNMLISQKDGRFYYAIWGGSSDEPATEEICEIQYLHQLQNLYYALTNQELNIQL